MRIRTPFAGAFIFLILLSAYAGLSQLQISTSHDKVLHFLDFFLLTLCFYWVLDTSRRRSLNFTLIICTIILGVGSEFVQALIPNGRKFDPYDIAANFLGSLSALGLCSWYHKRMLERKRAAKHYQVVPGSDDNDHDVELGEGISAQESGVTPSLEQEVDNWDDNAVDNWDDAEEDPEAPVTVATATSSEGVEAVDQTTKPAPLSNDDDTSAATPNPGLDGVKPSL
ncbi:MAG: hypothetical protein M1825_001534 [Sarcosagium campestre]|nr:MAG: hypothetical protein M1825_001534 [Sarcosagium campestre]